MKKTCYNCACRQALYMRNSYMFSKTNLGYCNTLEKPVKKDEGCRLWQPRPRPRATVWDLQEAERDVLEIQRLLGAKD